MFIAIQDSIINIEEIRNVNTFSTSFTVCFKNPNHPTDWLRFDYKTNKEMKEDLARVTEACLNYKKN